MPLGVAAGLTLLGAGGVALAADHPPITDQDLEARLLANPDIAALFLAVKYAPALVGLGLLIAAIVKRSTTPKELRPLPGPPPVSLFGALTPAADVFGAIGVFFASQVAASLVLSVAGRLWPGTSEISGVKILCTSMGFVPVAVWIFLRRAEVHRAAPRPPGGPSRIGGAAWTFCAASFGLIAAGFVVSLVFALVLDRKPEPQALVVEVLDPALPIDAWLIFGFGVFVAPFTEEAIFRGTLYPAIRRSIGRWPAAVIVSAVFAAIHMDLAAALPLFVLAMALTWLFERTDSILAPALVHAASNATSLVPLLMLSGKP